MGLASRQPQVASNMFQPTALLVMKHNITGLQYFCKTTRLHELCYYKGSGIHWKRHLKKHGKNVTVGVLGIYYDEDRCLKAAKEYSEKNNIGNNSEWANLIPENGLDGAPSGEAHPNYGKPSPCIGQKRPYVAMYGAANPMYGKKHSEETRRKRSEAIKASWAKRRKEKECQQQ